MFEIIDLQGNELMFKVDERGFRPKHYLKVLEARYPVGLFVAKQIDVLTDQVVDIIYGERLGRITHGRDTAALAENA